MKILIDIGHPAHVHYFRNFIRIMQDKGHKFLVTARDKEVTFKLLESYKIPFVSRGSGGKGVIGKIAYIFKGDSIILKESKKFRPDLFLSFSSLYAAHAAKLLGKPHITMDDTEHAIFEQLLYKPFTKTILTPSAFFKNLGAKQYKFKGFMELCYLHPNYFKPDPDILKEIGLKEDERFTVLRFVSWEASHDFGKTGLTHEIKINLLKRLLDYGKVFISSEGALPAELEKYRVKIPPEKIHDLLAYASLYIGEGATMASECAALGTPAIYVNTLDAGTLQAQSDYNLIYSFRNADDVVEKAAELLNTPGLKQKWQQYRIKMLSEMIDVTAFMVWFIENYPECLGTIQENQDYQLNFR